MTTASDQPDLSHVRDPGDPRTPLRHLELIDEWRQVLHCPGYLSCRGTVPAEAIDSQSTGQQGIEPNSEAVLQQLLASFDRHVACERCHKDRIRDPAAQQVLPGRFAQLMEVLVGNVLVGIDDDGEGLPLGQQAVSSFERFVDRVVYR